LNFERVFLFVPFFFLISANCLYISLLPPSYFIHFRLLREKEGGKGELHLSLSARKRTRCNADDHFLRSAVSVRVLRASSASKAAPKSASTLIRLDCFEDARSPPLFSFFVTSLPLDQHQHLQQAWRRFLHHSRRLPLPLYVFPLPSPLPSSRNTLTSLHQQHQANPIEQLAPPPRRPRAHKVRLPALRMLTAD
jgi:hypothetical protein